jgi:hypothetical protein
MNAAKKNSLFLTLITWRMQTPAHFQFSKFGLKKARFLALSIALLSTTSAQGQCPTIGNSTSGTLDTCFLQEGTGLNGDVFALALQPNGKVILGGLFTSYNGTARSRICRLNANGGLDSTFTPTGTG